MRRARRHVSFALVLAFCACSGQPAEQKPAPAEQVAERPPPATLDDVEPLADRGPSLLRLLLSEADPEAASRGASLPRANATKLSGAQTAAVLARLPDLVTEAGDVTDFAKRERSLPPPKTGEVVKTAFPPAVQKQRPASVDAADTVLKVLRQQPEGETPIAPHLSITFNKPMVAITSHDDTVADGVPVELEPKVEGHWRWVGSKTLLFEPTADRFPMATNFTARVPTGTSAATGETLADGVEWTFSTPPPRIEQFYPQYGTHGLDQVMFARFDQRIDPSTVLEYLKLNTGGVFSGAGVRVATPEEIDASDEIKQLVEQSQDGRWIAFRAAEPLPYDTNISVTFGKGTPSAEGPRRTQADQHYNFQTYGPLKVTQHRCGWGQCTPTTSFSFQFSNQLDAEKFDESWLKVEPSFPTMTVSQYGNWVHIAGRKPGRRKYKVTIDRRLTDQFAQTLEGDNTFEFEVGPAYPELLTTAGAMTVLDPSAKPNFAFHSVNYAKVRITAWSVTPENWGDYLAWMHDWSYRGKHDVGPPGKRVMNREIAIAAQPDELIETKLPLSDLLGGDDLGSVVLLVEPTEATRDSEMPKHPPQLRTWVQATRIGLDGYIDDGEFVGWVTTLKDGEPLGNVAASLARGGSGKTDEKGLVKLSLAPPENLEIGGGNYLHAKQGADEAFLPETLWNQKTTSWYARERSDSLQWYVFDDRQMYKPGEKVSVKGWIRAIENGEHGQIRLPNEEIEIEWAAQDPFGNEMKRGTASTTRLGGFAFDFELPKTPNLGYSRIELSAKGWGKAGHSHAHSFQIQEFRTPEFEVTATATEGPHLATEDTIVSVEAKYYAGGGLPNADVHWNVTTSQTSFTPPNQSEFSFGSWTPWWVTSAQNSQAETFTLSSKTDPLGVHNLKVGFGAIEPPRPMTVRAQATVFDVNRQAWTSTANLLVHPSEYYVGLKSDKYFVPKGTPLEISLIVSDIEGNGVAGRPVKVRATRTHWKYKNGQYMEEEKDPQDCAIVTDDKGGKCTFDTAIGGTYRIVATTVDDFGRRNFSEITRWVSGGERPISRKVEREAVMLIPDKDDYQPGETAQILVQSPIVPAEGLLLLQRNGMIEERRFTMAEPTTTLQIPIKETHLPNLHVSVNVVGSQPRLGTDGEPDTKLPRRPAFGSGALNLKIPPTKRALSVEIKPERTRLEPAADTWVDVEVTDAAGKPVAGAEVAVVVVDEAILGLTGYAMGNPLAAFYGQRPTNTRSYQLRDYVLLEDPAALASTATPEASGGLAMDGRKDRSLKKKGKSAMGYGRGAAAERAPAKPAAAAPPAEPRALDKVLDGLDIYAAEEDAGGGGGQGQAIAVRTNFDPLATFAPAVQTDGRGVARVKYTMPDNLTRYRVMALAVHEATHYGTGESNVTARLPLMVRPSAPRFLNFGDEFQLPVVLQNQTDEPMTVHVATRGSNIELTQREGWSVEVPADDRVEVRFPAAAREAGTARFQVGAAAGKWSDASEFSLPVWTPATSEAFATYGVIDEGSIAQPVAAPGEVWPQFGQLEVTTTSTALQQLTDAFLYLYDYDYECAEQISSRVVTVAALRDVLQAFEAEGMPTPAKVKASMDRDIEELLSRQNPDGGFGLWRRGQPSWPYVAIHASHALVRAYDKGYTVRPYALESAKRYLTNIERYIPHWWPEWVRLHAIAYSLYVRNLMGDADPAKAREVIRRGGGLDDISFESVGWLLGVMTKKKGYESDVAEIRRFLNNRVTETAAGAHFAARTDDSDYVIMRSDRVADGVILEALIADQPKSDLIPKIVEGLMAHRTRGRWSNTQENAFILLALDRYFNTYEKITPNFVARAWLGEVFVGEHTFRGRTTEKHHVDVPMKHIVAQDSAKLYLQKDGKGRMYYRIGMTYAPKSLFVEPADHGFVVERAYEPVDDDGDVKRRADGSWEIKAGAKVRIKLTMVAPTRRYHVALVDPLPAGLETMNPALAVTGDIPQDPNVLTGRSNSWGWWWWTRPWFEHQNMRDERTEAFTTLLWGGVHSYTYYARATTPGSFVVPPTKAEEMYHPETFGRSASDRVHVVD